MGRSRRTATVIAESVTVGAVLHAMRRRAGLSVHQVATRMRTSERAIELLEQGRRMGTWTTCGAYCRATGGSLVEIAVALERMAVAAAEVA